MPTRSMDIRIESIPAQSLLRFAREHLTASRLQPMAAITTHRALAHSVNPHATAGDIGLHVAYSDSTCIGYLGLLPTYLINGRDVHKVSFMSTFYVLPEYRHRHVAFALLRESLLLNIDLIVTDYTPDAGHLYQALGFAALGHIDYLVLRAPRRRTADLQRSAKTMDSQDRTCRCHKQSMAVQDEVGVTTRNYWLTCRAMVAEAKPTTVSLVDQVPVTFDPRLPSEKPHFCRNSHVVNWMLRYPWVRDNIQATDPPYYFSDVRPIFRQLAIRIDDRQGDSGILIVSLSERIKLRVIKMLDCYAPTDSMYATFFHVVCTYAARFIADEVKLPCDIQPHLTRYELPSDMVTWMRRDYLYHPPSCGRSAIPSDLSSLHLSYCDGDTAFT
jgi:hypothetical protein